MNKKQPSIIAAALALFCTTACGVDTTSNSAANPGKIAPNQIGAMVVHPDKQTGIICDWPTARVIDNLNGVQGATVLLEGTQAYVGLHLSGPEQVSKRERPYPSGQMIPVPDGRRGRTEASILNNGASPAGPAQSPMYAPYPRGDARTGPGSTQTGHIDTATQNAITHIVVARTGAKVIHMTAQTAQVGVLQGYASHITDGGTLKPFLDQFHQQMKVIWPS